MLRRRLFWKLFSTYSLVILFCMAVLGGFLVRGEHRTARHRLEADLAQRGRLLDERLAPVMDFAHAALAESLAQDLGRRIASRVTLIAPDGKVLADTDADPTQMENHRFRPEVQAALNGQVGSAIRTSASVFEPFLYVALPSRERPGWVVRVALPLTQFRQRERESRSILLLGSVAATVLALVLGFVFTRRIVRPLETLGHGLLRLERGEFGTRFDLDSADEIGQLARTLNRVQERLEVTIDSLTSQRNEREAILSSMVEGLIAVDGQDRIVLVNAAGRGLLGLDSAVAEGRPLLEAVRVPQLVQFVEQVRTSTQPLGVELVIRDLRLRYLELHGAPLRLSENGAVGAVVVFNDVTRLRKLEEVRKEFVANVSHELKTPVTSIKGFLETLLDGGALDEPESARRFLGIISRQTDRLAVIIEDLLYLSRLEYEEKGIALQPVDLAAVVERSVANFEHAARARGLTLETQLGASQHFIQGDGSLLARAVDNLVDNAIKYTPPGAGPVMVTLEEAAEEILLRVEDHGIGIPEEHLPRISERFYRVDTARSRELGGTGLGLAIVKHIARVHRGTLQVESRPGEGSRFTLRFPLHPAPAA